MGVLRLGITASTGGISATFSRNNVMNLIHGPILVLYTLTVMDLAKCPKSLVPEWKNIAPMLYLSL